jgi:predicted TIM-barrel fold metal-dependent hydrolase
VRRYPNLIVPFAMIDIDQTTPHMVADYAARGFRGLKIINPRRNYDDPTYFPVYYEAEKHNLVCLFHTGIVGGFIDYLQFPPTDFNLAAELSRDGEAHRRYQPGLENSPSWYGAGRMQPIFLDGISVAFPELRIIGAHLGYGLYDSAAAVARWRRNIYFDISGGTVVRRPLLDRHMLRSEVSTRKLVWGSDCDMAHMSRELSAWMAAFDSIGLSAEEQDHIFWGTAARIFGFED